MVREIPLGGWGGNAGVALVDDEDYERIAQFHWYRNKQGYAMRNIPRNGEKRKAPVSMHREVLGLGPGDAPGLQVDHKNHDRIDNRRDNLRLVTNSENGLNRAATRAASGYRGVKLHRQSGLWQARVQVRKRVYSVGYFATAEQANRAAVEFRRAHAPTSTLDAAS